MKQNNACEIAAAEQYQKEGWKIADSGWPDFLLYRWTGGKLEVKFAEVKSEFAAVQDNQKNVLHILSTLAPTVVRRISQETRIITPSQDQYFHRSDASEWAPCYHQENCNVKHHICEPRG